MKTILFLLVTVSAFAANARLHSHYGKLTQSGFNYSCVIRNNTNNTLDFKYVVFSFERRVGKQDDTEVQSRIDRAVRTGESLKVSTSAPAHLRATHCRFLAR